MKNDNTYERTMYYGAQKVTKLRAVELRKKSTEAEKILWHFLKKNRILGYKFRRQHPINIYIADFYCHSVKLVIEVDGQIHEEIRQKEWDISRDSEMQKYGIDILRFSNLEVLHETGKVISCIKNRLKKLSAETKY